MRTCAIAVAFLIAVTNAQAAPEPLDEFEILSIVEDVRFNFLPICCRYLISSQGITKPVRNLPGVGDVVCVRFTWRPERNEPARYTTRAYVRNMNGIGNRMKLVDPALADCANPELYYMGFSKQLPGIDN